MPILLMARSGGWQPKNAQFAVFFPLRAISPYGALPGLPSAKAASEHTSSSTVFQNPRQWRIQNLNADRLVTVQAPLSGTVTTVYDPVGNVVRAALTHIRLWNLHSLTGGNKANLAVGDIEIDHLQGM
jgi:hypothetical protein